MAEVVKKKNNTKEYKVEQLEREENVVSDSHNKENKRQMKNAKEAKASKKSLWVKFRIFCHGVKSEAEKIHWTTKNDMIKYSVATIVFVVFCSIFFYVIDILFAFIQSLI